MDDKKRGLADMQDGEFILNESGTSVSTDKVEGVDAPAPANDGKKDEQDEQKPSSAGAEEKDITV